MEFAKPLIDGFLDLVGTLGIELTALAFFAARLSCLVLLDDRAGHFAHFRLPFFFLAFGLFFGFMIL